MNLKPLGDRVIVKPAEAEEQTKSGLFIPDTAKEKPQKRQVVAVGDGKLKDDGTRVADRREGRRHGHLQQVRRIRGQDRRCRVQDPRRRARHHRRRRLDARYPEQTRKEEIA
jgi:hypothetical protein